VSLSANLEIGQSNLQQLLYDLETGMPFLFIDQLVVQMVETAGRMDSATETPRMRVQIDVSGQWQLSK
jgi:general secretion pathway protein M